MAKGNSLKGASKVQKGARVGKGGATKKSQSKRTNGRKDGNRPGGKEAKKKKGSERKPKQTNQKCAPGDAAVSDDEAPDDTDFDLEEYGSASFLLNLDEKELAKPTKKIKRPSGVEEGEKARKSARQAAAVSPKGGSGSEDDEDGDALA
eukprot:SAG11_NODE_16780_length_538_cov_0.473804_1_plen_148_part_01